MQLPATAHAMALISAFASSNVPARDARRKYVDIR